MFGSCGSQVKHVGEDLVVAFVSGEVHDNTFSDCYARSMNLVYVGFIFWIEDVRWSQPFCFTCSLRLQVPCCLNISLITVVFFRMDDSWSRHVAVAEVQTLVCTSFAWVRQDD